MAKAKRQPQVTEFLSAQKIMEKRAAFLFEMRLFLKGEYDAPATVATWKVSI